MRILFLDDDPARHRAFSRRSTGNHVIHVNSALRAAIALTKLPRFDVVYLDYDLHKHGNPNARTGLAVARHLAHDLPTWKRPGKVFVHSRNPPGAAAMVDTLRRAGYYVLQRPFELWGP